MGIRILRYCGAFSLRCRAAAVVIALLTALPFAASGADCVLFLGDSFSMGAFGRSFDGDLREDGFKVYTYAAGGASPYYWLSSYEPIPSSIGFWKRTPTTNQRLGYIRAVPKIEPLMDACKPDYVVVQTGVNLYAALRSKRRPKEENIAEVKSLIEGMCDAIHSRGARSFWVLPPSSHEDRYPASLQRELEVIMKEVISRHNGGFFQSLNFTKFVDPYPATDGIHYGAEESEVWAKKSVASFREFSKVSPSMLTSNQPPRARPVEIPDLKPSTQKSGDAPTPYVSTKPKVPELPKPNEDKKDDKAVAMAANSPKETNETGAEEKAADSPPAKPKDTAGVEEKPASDTPPKPAGMATADAKPEDAPAKVAMALDEVPVDAEYNLELKLVAKSEIKNINEVTYSSALGVFEYEVVKSVAGDYKGEKIRIAHGIVLNRKLTRANSRKIGDTISMVVVPLKRYPAIQRWQTVDDLRPNFEMPLFVPKL
jgi:hypothetical protein